MSDSKRRWPLTHMIHDTNHTQVNRVGNMTSFIYDTNTVTTLSGYTSGKQWTELKPGLYKITINSKVYIFDLYMEVTGDENYLEIDAYNKAFMRIALTDYPVILYQVPGSYVAFANNYSLDDTVNNWFDMLYISGYTEVTGDSPSIDNPIKLNSTASLEFQIASSDRATETYNIGLRNYIKSIGTLKDGCIINSELQKYHLIIRIGRTVFSGYEQWTELESYSTDAYSVFFCPNTNVVMATGTSTIQCTHFPTTTSSTLLSKSTAYNCIATCGTTSIGQGFLIKIDASLLDYVSNETHENHFQNWMNAIFTSGNSMVVEYRLAEPDYRDFLLEEYHVPTYYGDTTITLNTEGCEFAYFYKSL